MMIHIYIRKKKSEVTSVNRNRKMSKQTTSWKILVTEMIALFNGKEELIERRITKHSVRFLYRNKSTCAAIISYQEHCAINIPRYGFPKAECKI